MPQIKAKEIDLSSDIGYPLRLIINAPYGPKPLFWQSWSNDEQLEESRFLQALHDRLIGRFNQERTFFYNMQKMEEYGDFPAAPLNGSDIIVPITSWHELATEGKEMHHCIAAHAYQVHAGQLFVYRVLTKQRLTLAIAKRGLAWRISEVRGQYNALPNEESLLPIHNWFKQFVQ